MRSSESRPQELCERQGEDVDQRHQQRQSTNHGTGGHAHALEEDPVETGKRNGQKTKSNTQNSSLPKSEPKIIGSERHELSNTSNTHVYVCYTCIIYLECVLMLPRRGPFSLLTSIVR